MLMMMELLCEQLNNANPCQASASVFKRAAIEQHLLLIRSDYTRCLAMTNLNLGRPVPITNSSPIPLDNIGASIKTLWERYYQYPALFAQECEN